MLRTLTTSRAPSEVIGPRSPSSSRAELAYGKRRYADLDPLFGERRRDERTRLDLSVRSKQWRWMNFTPVLVFSLERNHSSLPFYGYRKANVSVMLE